MSNHRPLISIITIVYNGFNILEKTIQSVINQTYKEFEYIIIDGCSNDNTQQIILNYADKINFWISEKDNGIFDAMNKGLAKATGEWVIFMNAGDYFYDNNVLEKIFHENINKKIDLIYGDVALYSETDSYQVISKTNSIKINLNAICHQSVFIRRNLHPDFNIKYKLSADHDVIYDFIKRGNCLYFNYPISKILIGGVSSNLKKTRREKFRISLSKGNIIDLLFASLFYVYGFFKEFIKKVLLFLFPHKIFAYLRKLKNTIE